MPFFSLHLWFLLNALALQPRLNVTELSQLSDRVVVAYVTSAEVRWSAGPEGGLETLVWLSPQHHLKGEPTDTLQVLVMGGELNYHQTWVEDEPKLIEDRRYLLFLRKNRAGNWRVLGGPQGAITLHSEQNPTAPYLKDIPVRFQDNP
jgi:hypothetical protein